MIYEFQLASSFKVNDMLLMSECTKHFQEMNLRPLFSEMTHIQENVKGYFDVSEMKGKQIYFYSFKIKCNEIN